MDDIKIHMYQYLVVCQFVILTIKQVSFFKEKKIGVALVSINGRVYIKIDIKFNKEHYVSLFVQNSA